MLGLSDNKEREYKLWHPNGNLWVHACRKNEKFEGECREWFDNGQLFARGFYQNGIRSGEHEMFHRNGQIRTKEYYENGVREGLHEIWSSKGVILHKGIYRNGLEEGLHRNWHDNGKPRSITLFRNGKCREYRSWRYSGALSNYIFYPNLSSPVYFNMERKILLLKFKRNHVTRAMKTIDNFLIKDLTSLVYRSNSYIK